MVGLPNTSDRSQNREYERPLVKRNGGGSMVRRQARGERRMREILDAALTLFAEAGYDRTSTNAIAARAEISPGSLYQYFPNKDAILVELMTAHVDDGFAMIRHAIEGGLPDSLEDTLRIFVRAAIDNHRDAPRLHRVMFEEAPRPPDFLLMLHRSEDDVVDLAETLLAGHPDVSVADTRTAARLVVAAIESLVHRLIAAPNPVEADPFEDELVAMLTRYLTG